MPIGLGSFMSAKVTGRGVGGKGELVKGFIAWGVHVLQEIQVRVCGRLRFPKPLH